MQSTTPPSVGVPVAPALSAAFATIPDPRGARGKRFSLVAMLNLAVAAMLANHLSELAIAEWGAAQSRSLLHALGFARGVTPHQTTVQRLFRALDPACLARALTASFATSVPTARGQEAVAIDGKTLRGRLPFAPPGAAPIHLLTLYCQTTGAVLAHAEIAQTGDKAAAALTVAPALLAEIDWTGRVLTGDALFCQRNLCAQVVGAGGDDLVVVKENQATLRRDLATLFATRADAALRAATLPVWDMREVTQGERGHGRTEQRHLVASTELNDYLDWPHLAQVCCLERTWSDRKGTHTATRYLVTSLPPAVADAARLLTLARGRVPSGRVGIENGLHYVKDVTLREDASTLHAGAGPTVLAMLRDTAVTVLHQAGVRAVASRLRYHSTHPEATLALLGLSPPEHA